MTTCWINCSALPPEDVNTPINVSDDVNTDVKNKDVNNSNANDNTYNHGGILNSNDMKLILMLIILQLK